MIFHKTIAIIIDNPLRDLPACCLLGLELVSRGWQVDFVPFYGCKTFLFEKSYDVVLLNYARKNNQDLIRRLFKTGSRIGILDTEGGVFGSYKEKDSNDYLQTVIEDEQTRHLIDHYYVWGENVEKMVRIKSIYQDRQIKLTGTPRSDFYDQAWSTFFELPEKWKAELGQDFVLITSSFPMVNPAFQSVEAEKKMMIETFGYSPEYIDSLFQKLKQAQTQYIESAKKLSQRFPEQKIVYRPHPFEDLKIYQKEFAEFRNIYLVKEGVVGQWLASCLCLIHFESSTSFEAQFSQKPVFGFCAYKDIWDMPEIQAVTDYVSHNEELFEKIEKVAAGTYRPPASVAGAVEDITRKVFFKIDGQAHIRIANSLETMTGRSLSGLGCFYQKLIFISESVRMLGKRLVKWEPAKMQAKHFSIDQVHAMTSQLCRIAPERFEMPIITERGWLRHLGFTPIVSIVRQGPTN